MRRKLTVPVVIGFALTVTSVAWIASGAPLASGEISTFQNSTNIIFREFIGLGRNNLGQEIPRWKEFSVSDPKEIHRLIGSLNLVAGGPEPSDDHLDEVLFEQPSGVVRVSFCHICFNVVENEHPYKDRRYAMPKEFFDEFQALARKQGWQEK